MSGDMEMECCADDEAAHFVRSKGSLLLTERCFLLMDDTRTSVE